MRKSKGTAEKIEIANRLRQIRNSAKLTQEKFAEILGISLSAYKKIECGENQISIECVRKMEKELNVSSDYILFGRKEDLNEIWKMVLNCSEEDKMFLLIRLLGYFIKGKEERYYGRNMQDYYDKEIINIIREMDV